MGISLVAIAVPFIRSSAVRCRCLPTRGRELLQYGLQWSVAVKADCRTTGFGSTLPMLNKHTEGQRLDPSCSQAVPLFQSCRLVKKVKGYSFTRQNKRR
ncbi:hypothetical protein DPEC_G00319670 [Dallia pectoralis]|uniref:Uncharacterized protein n=1 Tax=Dallia pectoralis TaxID=75939 RepID=A0ACC2F9U4_DALPE|nr:hypothetical protein DPEC_G00319670 [Dallia pectoralis]